jgi:hypothetical protein
MKEGRDIDNKTDPFRNISYKFVSQKKVVWSLIS